MPDKIQDVIINMCYQLGVTSFGTFQKTIFHFKNKDWEAASVEMLNSKWHLQTPARSERLSAIVKSVEED